MKATSAMAPASRSKTLALLGLSMSVAAALSGCGDGAAEASAAPPAQGTPSPTPPAPPPPAPTPSPPTPAPAPSGAVTLYFSDCQAGAATDCVPGSNANPGTNAAPKQTLAGINVNALPAGSQLLFKRGGSWNWSSIVRLDNRNTSAAAPLTFGAYGSGSAPLLRVSSQFAFETGEWANTTPDGGYTFRGLRLDGMNAVNASKGIWLRGTVSDVLIDDVELTGFYIGLYGQGHDDIQRVTVRNSRLVRNSGMGMLGTFNNSVFEDNLYEGNNFSGSGFDHGIYMSNSSHVVIRRNTLRRNSVVGGVCTGGNMTFHGQMDDVLIEGNTIQQDVAAPQCWLMSITQGYNTAEWFRNFVVRNNRLINPGNTGIAMQSAPGIVVEGNTVWNQHATVINAFSVGHTDYPNGDVADGGAVMRNNTLCTTNPVSGNNVVMTLNAGTVTLSGNVTRTGADASTGPCAR